MDDDYDKYVPQISTMDWQQLGGAGGQDGGGVGPSGSAPGAPSSSSSFLYDNSGQMMAGGGQFQQQQRSFPGMGIGGTAAQGFPGAEYVAGGGGGPQAYQTGGFIPGPAGMQSQMAAAQQQQQQMQQQHRQMMAAAQQQQYGTGPGGPYSTMPPPSTGKASASSQPAGTSTKAKSSSKKSKKAQAAEAAAAAAAAAQQQNAVDQQQQGQQQQMASGGPAGTQQPQQQQYPMPGQMLGGFYYKGAAGAPGPPVVHQQPPQMMSPTSGGGGGQQMTAQAAGKWPQQQQPGYQQVQQQQQEEQQRQQVQQQFGQMAGAAQQSQAVQQPQQHYGPLQHLQQQYGGPPQTAQQLQYQAYAQQQQSAQPQAAKAAQEQQPKVAQGQPPPGQYGMAPQQQAAAAAAYYGQQQYGHAGPAAAAAAAQQQYMMGMPPQQQAQQAAAAGYPMAAAAGYPPAGYTAAMQKQQAYYAAAQQQQMAMAQGPGGVQAAGAVSGAAGMMAYYQQQQQAPPYGPGPTMVMPNPYVVQQQQQQCYREMYECDQQLGQAMGQAQQQQQQPSPELAMRIEKLQMHRQYLHGQMIQLQQAAHAAAAAAAGAPPPMGMAPQGVQGVPARVDQQQQPQSAPPGVPYQQQQQYQPQMVAVAQPGGQQGASSKMPQSSVQAAPPPPPYVSSVPPPQQYPPPAGFHSPGAPQSVPTSQHQPPTPQQVVQQQPQQQMQPQYAPHMSSPSVAVMSASSQVQVNIRPELPGRTMISVYHSPDVPTSGIQPAAVVSSAAMPYQMQAGSVQMAPQQLQQQHQADAAGMAAVKDSIPPEPLPPNLAQEQKRRQKQQQKMLEQQQEQQAKMQQQIKQQQQQQQQSPQVQAVQHAEKTQLQPEQKPKSPPPRPKTPPPASATIHLNFFGPGRLNTTTNCSRTFALAREDAVEFSVKEFVPEPEPVVEEVQQKVEPMALDQSQEAEEKPDDQQQLVLTEGEEDEHEQPSEITEMLIHREEQQRLQKQASSEKGEAKEKLEAEKLEAEADVKMEEEEKPEEEEQKQHVEAVPAIVIGAMEPGTSSAGLELELMTPSNSDLQLECKGGDDKESTADESQWPGTSTKETTPQDAEDFPFSFRATKGSTSRKSSAPGGTKSGKLRSRKRKMDWNRDEDDDYVGRRRRKKGAAGSGNGGRKDKKLAEEEEEEEMLAMEMAVVEPSDFLDDDLLVEKRRSARKSAGGKRTKYGEDSENDEELGKPLTPKNEEEDELAEQLEERVVEKILGVRIAKRVVKRGKKKVEIEGGKKEKKKKGEGKAEKAEENQSITAEGEKTEKAEQNQSIIEEEAKAKKAEKTGGSQSIIEKERKAEKAKEERAEKAEENQSITEEVEKKEKEEKAEKEKTAEQEEKEAKGMEEKEKQEGESEKTEETEEKSEKKHAEDATKESQDATKESEAKEDVKAQEDVEMKASVEGGDDSESPKAADVDIDATEEEVEELYVKFKGYSYLHCEWKTLEELEQLGDKRVPAKLNRWKQKFGDTITVAGEEDEQEYFNEDYTVVARVLDETYDELEQQHYIFVKWKALPYEDCTWENIQDVPEQKLAEFRRRIEFDQCKVKEQNRLSPKEWSSRLAIVKERLYKNDNVLREYQHEGVNWLLWTWTNSRNCILADEMGLGKTVQTIVFFQSLYDVGIHGPFLVVVPLSTLGNWEREFDNWTDINAIVYHGGANSRRIIQEYEFFYKRPDAKKRNITKFDALITTYEVVVQEVEVLKRINFRVCVIDEAHRIKNRNCKLLQTGLLSLKMEHRVLLTGTPLQNNIQELFSLLNFLEPEQFANSEAFLQQFGQCQTEEQVQKLQEILKPMMLRRLKEDVEKELQPKEETIIEVQLSNIQKKYYRAVLERNFTHLMKGTTPSLINTMMQLRKCCNHPYLINGAEEQILAELKVSHPELATAAEEQQLHVLGLISSSGKLVLIDKLLPKLHTDGHKVLIFSQMVRVLDLLEEYLNIKNYPFERIDGNIRGNERQAAIDRFSKPENKDRFVFLLCTRAGGLGINLTAADTVIIFDSDWNPQNDLQAQARCHRIGQTKPVKIYRLITSNTYEREMFDKASLKLGLDKAVLQSMLHRADAHGGGSIQQMSRQEVEDLLRKGAYGAIMDENEEGAKFSEEDIDTILQRRTQTIRLEPGVKGSTFAKASFTTTLNRDDIDIGDPDFWSKWARKANIDMDALNSGPDGTGSAHLIVHEPRARKKRFEADNFNKGNSESGDEGQTEDDDRNSSTPGTSRIAEGVKSRSARKKRRTAAGTNAGGGEEDDDYAYKPDELAFSKSVYFKVEKLLTQWGWGRWATMKQTSDLGEHDLEHISRTLLLHCISEFRGDEKVQDYVWSLISPLNPPPASSVAKANGTVEKLKTGSKAASNTDSKSKFHQGWAALPEYNPPFICVDMTFQRHLHRHSNKLLNRVLHLHFLHTQIEELQQGEGEEQDRLKAELLPATEALDGWLIMPQWDRECDRDLLLGVHKHGMENWEQIRTDPSLCFMSKTIIFPNTLDLNNRFKYLVALLQRRTEASPNVASTSAASASTAPTLGNSSSSKLVMIEMSKWTKVEESDFMRILRNYGVKDDTNSENVINWARFREISIVLKHKSDAEMLEMLYCVLAMCTKQQGGMLSPVDERRADRVEAIAAKSAEKLMNRLHLMRKVHAIITMGIQNIRGMLKMVALDVMPKGWSEAHDEHLLIVVDKFGLEDIHGKLKHLPKLFDAIHPLDEHILLRRVVEICATLENGKWTGTASTDNLEDSTTAGSSSEGQQQGTSGSSSTSVIATKGRSGAGKGQASGGASAGGNGRRKGDQSKQQKGSMADKNAGNMSIVTASGGTKAGTSSAGGKTATATMSYNEQQILLKMMEQMSNPQYLLQLMSMMGPSSSSTTGTSSTASSSSNSMAALQQQFQQLQTLLTLTALSGSGSSDLNTLSASLAAMSGTSTSSSTGILPKASSASTDVLNLSKKSASTDTKAASSSTPTSAMNTSFGTQKSGTTSSIMSSAISAAAVKPAFTSADACLSTGLSSSAINKLSAMSVPELLAYSNLGQETRIPVIHADTQQKLEGDKAPTLKSLDQFLRSNQKYSVDLLSLATSHPSLFSGPGNPVMSMGSAVAKTPSTPTITQQQKKQQAQTPSGGHINSSGTTTPTQQQQPVKKSGLTATSMLMGGNKSGGSSTAAMSAGNTLSSSLSSLFGMDLGSSSSTCNSAANSAAVQSSTAALNQFLAGLSSSSSSTPSQQSQQLSNQLQSALNSSASSSSSSLKQMEQQLLLLQQAAMLGGTGGGGTSTASFNPYTALLYQNPGELFGLKTTTSSASSTAASMQSALLAGGSSTNPLAALNDQSTMAAAAALAQAAAAFPSGGSGSAAATADLTSALTSELYMAAMASTLPSLLGGGGSGGAGGGGQGTTAQNNATALQQQQQAASSNASLYANVNAATLEQLLAAAGLSAGAASGLLGTAASNASSMKPAGTIKVEPGKSAQMPSSTGLAFPLQQAQRSAESPSSSATTMAKKGQGTLASGCKGLKLNALLEKLASAGGVANASTTSGPAAAASTTTSIAMPALASAEECGVAQNGEEQGNVPQTAKEEEEKPRRRRAEEAAESGRGEEGEGDGEKKPKEEE